jgi:hypothetical protein
MGEHDVAPVISRRGPQTLRPIALDFGQVFCAKGAFHASTDEVPFPFAVIDLLASSRDQCEQKKWRLAGRDALHPPEFPGVSASTLQRAGHMAIPGQKRKKEARSIRESRLFPHMQPRVSQLTI